MKKHAFLIGVYQNPNYLKELIASLDSERSNFYIHVNAFNINEFIPLMNYYKSTKKENVIFVPSVKVRWGGVTLLRSLYAMLNEAYKDSSNYFFHFLTGQDILIKPIKEFFKFFDKNSEKNFVNYTRFPYSSWGKDGGIYRYKIYHLFDLLNCRSKGIGIKIEHIFSKIQKVLKITRKPLPFEQLYAGSPWWSLNKKGMDEVKKFLDFPSNWSYLKYTFAPDEVIVQDILMNSPLKSTIYNDNLRYIEWKTGNPEILTLKHWNILLESNAFFARKIHPQKSIDLIKQIDKYINNK